MALNTYEVEIKAIFGSLDIQSSTKIFSGQIKSSGKYCTLFTPSTQVLCCIPSSLLITYQDEDITIALVPEEFVLQKPNELSYENAVQGVVSLFKTLTALHYTLNVLQNESIFIINSPDFISINLSLSLGLTVFYTVKESTNKKEETKTKAIKINEVPDGVIAETGGLGVNYVLDFSNGHDWKSKKAAIDCLAIRGKWAVCDANLQLDPPESYQMFMRNASVCWVNEDMWTWNGVEHGKFLHLLNTAMKYLRDGIDGR